MSQIASFAGAMCFHQSASQFTHLFCYPSSYQQVNRLRCSTPQPYIQINRVKVALVVDAAKCTQQPVQGCEWKNLTTGSREFELLQRNCAGKSVCKIDAGKVLAGNNYFERCGLGGDRNRNTMTVDYNCLSSTVTQATASPSPSIARTVLTTMRPFWTFRTFRTSVTPVTSLTLQTGQPPATNSTQNATTTAVGRDQSERTTPNSLTDTQLILIIFFSCLVLVLIILVIFLIIKYHKIQRLKLEVSQEGRTTL